MQNPSVHPIPTVNLQIRHEHHCHPVSPPDSPVQPTKPDNWLPFPQWSRIWTMPAVLLHHLCMYSDQFYDAWCFFSRREHPSLERLPALTPQEEAPRPRLAMSASLYSLRHVASSSSFLPNWAGHDWKTVNWLKYGTWQAVRPCWKTGMAKNWSQLENHQKAINNLEPL